MSGVDPESGVGVSHISDSDLRSRHAKADRSRRSRSRALVSMVLLILDVVTLGVTLADIHGSPRFVLGVAFGLFVPGWSVVGWLHLRNAALEFSLTVATSLALLTVIAQVLVTVHAWHLFALQVATCAVCLPLLAWQARRLRQSRS